MRFILKNRPKGTLEASLSIKELHKFLTIEGKELTSQIFVSWTS